MFFLAERGLLDLTSVNSSLDSVTVPVTDKLSSKVTIEDSSEECCVLSLIKAFLGRFRLDFLDFFCKSKNSQQ